MDSPRRLLRVRGVRYLLPVVAVVAALVVIALPAGLANLGNSNFDAGDGNLVTADADGGGPDTADVKDWQNIGINCTSNPKVGCGLDQPTGKNDDSFGEGTSEDDAVPTIVNGRIPNNKSDLTRLYATGESGTDGHILLYLAWERVQEPTGTTNMDFELNQNKCAGVDANDHDCTSNLVTPDRKAGDVLIKYDLAQGGTNPVLGFHVWVTSGACEKNGQSPPCWGPVNEIDNTEFEASINTSSVTDPINPNAPRTLDPRTFGEAAVDLVDAGIVPATGCTGFASVYLKSRSSDSFSSAIKDFIAPIPSTVNTCGSVRVRKEDDAGNAIGGVKFTLWKDNPPLGPPDGTQTSHSTAEDVEQTSLTCTTASTTSGSDVKGECTISNVPQGQYWVVEDPSSVPSSYSATAPDQHAKVTSAGQLVDLTSTPFKNPRKHKVIVLVCHEGTNTLVASDVTNGSTTKTSLAHGATLPTGVDEAELCGLGGAAYGGKAHQDDDDYKVDVGKVSGALTSPHN